MLTVYYVELYPKDRKRYVYFVKVKSMVLNEVTKEYTFVNDEGAVFSVPARDVFATEDEAAEAL